MAFSLFTTYSRADIYFADFFSNDFGPSMSLECWNEDGTFNEDNCNRSEFECSFQGSEKNFEAKKVIFQFSEEHLNKIKRNGEYYISKLDSSDISSEDTGGIKGIIKIKLSFKGNQLSKVDASFKGKAFVFTLASSEFECR